MGGSSPEVVCFKPWWDDEGFMIVVSNLSSESTTRSCSSIVDVLNECMVFDWPVLAGKSVVRDAFQTRLQFGLVYTAYLSLQCRKLRTTQETPTWPSRSPCHPNGSKIALSLVSIAYLPLCDHPLTAFLFIDAFGSSGMMLGGLTMVTRNP